MIENTEVYASMDLTQLAEEAVSAADAAVRNSRAAVVQAVNAGRLLIAAKAKVEHGQFGEWLAEHWVGETRSKRSAQFYMDVVRKVDELGTDVSEFDSVADILRQFKSASLAHLGDTKTQRAADLEPTPAANLTPADIPEPEPQVTTPAERDPQPRPTIREVTPETTQQIDRGTSEPPRNAVDEVFAALERLADEQADQQDMANRLRALADKLDPPEVPATYQPGPDVVVPSALNNETALAAVGRWVDYVNASPNSKTIAPNSPQEQELFRLLLRWGVNAETVEEMVSRGISSGWDNLQRIEQSAEVF